MLNRHTRFRRTMMVLVGTAGLCTGAAYAQPAPDAVAPAKPAQTEPLPKIDEIMDKFLAATGGKDNWAKIKTMTMTGAFELAGANIKGTTSLFEGEGNKLLSITSLGPIGEIKQGSDGETMWATDVMSGPRLIVGEERDMLVALNKLTRPEEWKKLFKTFEVVAVENVSDKPAYKVVGVFAGETKQSVTQFFDKESGLISKVSMTMSSPQGEIPIEIFTTDYKEVGGVKIAYKTRTVLGGAQEMINTLEKIEVNPEIPAEKFALPPEIKELRDAEKAKADKPKDSKPAETPAAKPEKK